MIRNFVLRTFFGTLVFGLAASPSSFGQHSVAPLTTTAAHPSHTPSSIPSSVPSSAPSPAAANQEVLKKISTLEQEVAGLKQEISKIKTKSEPQQPTVEQKVEAHPSDAKGKTPVMVLESSSQKSVGFIQDAGVLKLTQASEKFVQKDFNSAKDIYLSFIEKEAHTATGEAFMGFALYRAAICFQKLNLSQKAKEMLDHLAKTQGHSSHIAFGLSERIKIAERDNQTDLATTLKTHLSQNFSLTTPLLEAPVSEEESEKTGAPPQVLPAKSTPPTSN